MSQGNQEISISLRDLVRFVLNGAVFAVALAALAGGVAYLLAQRQPPVFQAEATVLVARTTGGFSQFGLSPVTAPPIDISAYRAAGQSDRVLRDALQRLGVEEPSDSQVRSLRSRTTNFVSGDSRESSLLGVQARGATAIEAVSRADAVADALVAWDQRRATESLTRVITTLEQQINALGEQIRAMQSGEEAGLQTQIDGLIRLRAEQQQQLSYARALVASADGLLSVMQSAGTTPRQTAPRPVMDAMVAALLAVVLTYGILLVRTALNTRMHSVEAIANASGLKLLAEIPRVSGPKEEWRQQEAVNYLRTNVLFATSEVHPKVILVTSADEQEGKTTVACQLAESLARNGYRTLLVDADLRSPSVATRYGFDESEAQVTTTRDWMRDTTTRNRNVLLVTLDRSVELSIVPQFFTVSDSSHALARGFPRALAQWDAYDVIVVDTAPILAVADTLAIAPFCSGTVLVVDTMKTERRKLDAARSLLDGVGVEILGVVANKVRRSSRGASYGSAYGKPVQTGVRGATRARGEVAGPVVRQES